MCVLAHTHTCVCSLPTHTRVASHTHVCVLARTHTHVCVSECSSGASFNTSVQKRRNLRVATSPTVLNRISLHHLSSSIRLKASRSLPRKKFWTVFLVARAGAEAVQNHTFHQILNCSARAPDRISLHRLSSSVRLKPSRSALWLTVFSCQLAFFDSARQSRGTVQNQRCLQSRGL